MRTSILSYFLLFLTAVLSTVPASYGQGDTPTPPRFSFRSGSPADFRPDFSWNALRPLTYVGNNVAVFEFFTGLSGSNNVSGRVITAHSPGSVAGKWQYRNFATVPWTDLPTLNAGEGFLLYNSVDGRVRFVPLVEQGIALNDASAWEQFAEALANAETLPTFSYRVWDESAGTRGTVATLTALGASISSLETEKTIALDEITDNPLPAGRTESSNNPRFRAYFSEKSILLTALGISLDAGVSKPTTAAGDQVNGRVITAYSSGSVAGKWQYQVGSSSPWEDLPAVDEGKGFLLEEGIVRVRFVPQVAVDNRLAVEQFAEAVANADTPPTLSLLPWDESEGTTETVATLADISTSVFFTESARTVTLNRLTNRVEREAESTAKRVAAAEKEAKVDALAEVSDGILSAVQSSTEISTLSAATDAEKAAGLQRDSKISALETAATQRDAEISTLKAAITALQGTGVATNPGTDPVNTNNPATTNNPANDKDAVLHVVAASSADEGVRAYPNPTSRLLQVAGLAPAQTYIYRLHTSDGKHVSQGTLLTNEPIDISALGKGQYLLTIQDETGKQLFTTPLVVQ